jgi:hypothetical protein
LKSIRNAKTPLGSLTKKQKMMLIAKKEPKTVPPVRAFVKKIEDMNVAMLRTPNNISKIATNLEPVDIAQQQQQEANLTIFI